MIKEAVKRKLCVVKEDWLDRCITDGRRVTESGSLIRGEAREEPAAGGKRKETERKTTVIVKGKGAVHRDSGMDDCAHVLERGGCVYSATLNKTDLAAGTNSFYVLQVIESDSKLSTHIFRAWGRIGTTVGGNLCEHKSVDECIKDFKKYFLEKTGNRWEDRKNFVVQPGKFNLSELGIASEDAEDGAKKKQKKDVASNLPAPVERLMALLFDEEMMKRTMMEMEVDLEKMPLGNLSQKQIKRGYGALTELQDMLGNAALDEFDRKQAILGASNKFYSIIPQSFGTKGLSEKWLIDTEEKLLEKLRLVESLLELEIAVGMINSKGSEEESAGEARYRQLRTDLSPIAEGSEEWSLVNKYMQNTHGKTHTGYSLSITDLFSVEREGESARFKPHSKDPNRQLLWHGSRLSNWASILSQGLRIAPPEAPVTGYMFGKGVYFADASSKSANYCMATPQSNEALLLLSEVALGDMHELTRSQVALPKNKPADKLSVKGVGKTTPDPKGTVTMPDGVVVPCGELEEKYGVRSELIYNEYIVYDTSQIKTRYLVRVKFDFQTTKRGGR